MKFNFSKNKIIATAVILVVLTFAFWYGGGAPGLQGWSVKPKTHESVENKDTPKEDKLLAEEKSKKEKEKSKEDKQKDEKKEKEDKEQKEKKEKEDKQKDEKKQEKAPEKPPKKSLESRPGGTEGGLSASEKVELAKKMAGGSSAGVEKGSKSYSESRGMKIDSKTGKDKYLTDPVPEGKPIPIEPQNTKITNVERYCTLSVRCDTILNNMDWLNPEKVELVPKDGVIFATKRVKFYEGESVFNLLLREMKKAKIHMEFSNTPMYNSAYIEGINNLYEFDCGELSGWMYKVNGWFPNYGCSRYGLKEGDVVEWVYTCNLGVDVGGFSAIGGE